MLEDIFTSSPDSLVAYEIAGERDGKEGSGAGVSNSHRGPSPGYEHRCLGGPEGKTQLATSDRGA